MPEVDDVSFVPSRSSLGQSSISMARGTIESDCLGQSLNVIVARDVKIPSSEATVIDNGEA